MCLHLTTENACKLNASELICELQEGEQASKWKKIQTTAKQGGKKTNGYMREKSKFKEKLNTTQFSNMTVPLSGCFENNDEKQNNRTMKIYSRAECSR